VLHQALRVKYVYSAALLAPSAIMALGPPTQTSQTALEVQRYVLLSGFGVRDEARTQDELWALFNNKNQNKENMTRSWTGQGRAGTQETH